MNNPLASNIAQYLKSYSALVEYWDDDAGDTHQILDLREILFSVQNSMNNDEISILIAIDNAVMAMAAKRYARETWDVVMLRKTSDFVRAHSTVLHAA